MLKFYFASIFQSSQHLYEKREGSRSGSVPLTNGSGSGRPGSGSPTLKKKEYLFVPKDTWNLLLDFATTVNDDLANFFCKHYFSPLNISMRKGKDPDPDPYI